jgi:mono/diheme cytochrome c family protein
LATTPSLEPPTESSSRPRPPTVTALAVVLPAVLILAALPFVRVADATGVPELLVFFGRFHPTILHLPVTLLLLALVLEGLRLPALRRFAPEFPATVQGAVLWLAALSGFAAAVTGWLLSHEGGYDAPLLEQHLVTGVATAIGAFLSVLLRSLATARPDQILLGRLAPALVAGTALAMVVAAHFGGSLTHGDGYLTEHAPALVRRLAGLPVARDRTAEARTPIAERTAFEGATLRIFEGRCTTCHNAGKLKGGLRLDTYEGVLAGGRSGAVVVAGNPDASELLKRVRLPVEDKGHMPPKGKTPLTDDEVAVLAWWVEAGAPRDGTLKSRKAPAEVRVAFARTLPEGERRGVEELQKRQASEYEATLESLRASVPGSLRVILPGERDLEYTGAVAGAAFGDAELRKLEPVGKDLLWLDLSRTGVTDAGLGELARMPNLERLDLRGTAVGDEGLKALTSLDKLQTLSLYGTRVTDAGLPALGQLASLQRLYVGGTAVTEKGLEGLRKTRSELRVVP